jgi:hypothetical protein
MFGVMALPIIGAILGAILGIFIDNKFFKHSFNYVRFSVIYFGLVLLGIFIGAEISYTIWRSINGR